MSKNNIKRKRRANNSDSSIKNSLASISKETRKLTSVFFLSLFLMIFLSPLYGIIWLFFSTLYLLTNHNFKKMYFIWGLFFSIWYTLFIFCMSDFGKAIVIAPDLIGYGYKNLDVTISLFNFLDHKFSSLLYNPSVLNAVLANFCLQTIVVLHWFSVKLGCKIYIPSIYKGVLYLIKYFSRGNKFD